MEAHEALTRHEHVTRGGDHGGGPGGLDRLSQQAAVAVAVMAAFLAVATFMANEAVKEVITEETQAADTSARLEANDTKTTIADANAVLLRVVGAGNPSQIVAVAKAEALEKRIKDELAPVDRRLKAAIASNESARDDADQQHLLFELASVALQMGIVLAGISILARRRWLLGGGVLVATVGVGLLAAGAFA